VTCEIVLFDSRFDYSSSAITRFCATPVSIRAFRPSDRENGKRMNMPRSFEPHLPSEPLRRLLSVLQNHPGDRFPEALLDQAEIALAGNTAWKLEEAAIYLVLSDLAKLGWKFKVVRNTIYMVARDVSDLDPKEAKGLLRKSLHVQRAHQLAEPTTRSFLEGMHRPRTFKGQKVSIENLIDDGKTLADAIRGNRGGNLSDVVDPYIVPVDPRGTCEQTGLKHMEIWRYFRHTWATEYRATPGRTLCFLIRNRARKDHPVMGILGLANAVFQLKARDYELGWAPESIIERVVEDESYWATFHKEAMACLREAKKNIRCGDLLRGIIKNASLEKRIKRLMSIKAEQAEARKEHLSEVFRNQEDEPLKRLQKTDDGKPDWKAASETPLFKRKRAETLADILFAEHILRKAFRRREGLLGFVRYVKIKDDDERVKGNNIRIERWLDPEFERAFKIALREIKKNGVATRILDVNVCGASPVYREVLGGKLAAYALFAEEIQQEYLKRYGTSESEIASSMAGRPIVKSTRICALTTTSLYGVGSSQYNRVRMRYGDDVLKWEEIGKTEGYGTIHMSGKTIQILRDLTITRKGRRDVNNRFGEGTNPLMRQLREGLSLLGFEPGEVLQHSNERIIYLLELYPRAKEDLALNRDRHPVNPSMQEVAKVWFDRWFTMRVRDDQVLERLSAYSVQTVRNDLGIATSGKNHEQNNLPLGDI